MIKKILVSQPKPSSDKSPYYDIATDLGVELVFRPFFKVEGLSAKEFRQQKVNPLDYTAVVFTSRHAVDNYFSLAKEMRITIPEDMKYFCVIETIALYIQKYVQYRKRKVFFGNTGKIDSLIPTMQKHKVEKYLVPQSSVHTDALSKLLDANKLKHKECVMYRTVSNGLTEEEVKNFDYDMLVFFSPTGVKALKENIPGFEQGDIKIAAFGPATAREVEAQGLKLEGISIHDRCAACLSGKTEEEIAKEDGFSSGRKGRGEAAFCNDHTGITGWDGNGKAGRKTEKERTPVQQEAHRRTLRNRGQSCHDSLPFESGLQTGRQRVGPFLPIS